MRRTLASLILLLAASPLWGQIVVPAKVQLGEPIEATTPFEAKAYQWESDSRLKPHADGRGTFVWARPGKHSITLIAVTESYEIKKWTASFEVIDSPLPPTPVTLRELAGADAEKLAEYFNTIAGQITSTTTPAKFWAGYEASFKITVSPELDTALRTRLTTALLDLPTLADSLRAIAAEFKEPGPEPPIPVPPTPPVVEGKRDVVIVHESADKTPEFGSLVVELRKPGTNADNYLKSKGHTLTILDDELLRESRWNSLLGSRLDRLPRLFIVDPRTNAILFEVAIPPGYTADQITERIRETGG